MTFKATVSGKDGRCDFITPALCLKCLEEIKRALHGTGQTVEVNSCSHILTCENCREAKGREVNK